MIKITPTAEMIEAGAHAAWLAYARPDGIHEFLEDTWPYTGLAADADQFRSAARACFIAMMKVGS